MIPGKQCRFCHQFFKPHPRATGHQYTCGQALCQKKRKAETDQAFYARYPHYGKGRLEKRKQWLKSHPGYYQNYRHTHLAYTQRESERMRRKRKREKTVAKQVVIRAKTLEKLRDCEGWMQKWGAETVAKQVVIPPSSTYESYAFQGMECLLDYLFMKEGVAKQVGIDNF